MELKEILEELGNIINTNKQDILKELESLKNGFSNLDYFYLKMLKNKAPFLKILSDSKLESLGKVILDNTKKIKTNQGLFNILKSVYGDTADIEFVNPLGGKLHIIIRGAENVEEHIKIYPDGAIFIYPTGEQKIYSGYSELDNINYLDFLQNFILAGVNLNIEIKPKRDYQGYIINQNSQYITDQNGNRISYLYRDYQDIIKRRKYAKR